MQASGPRIVVLGSINMDLIVRCQQLPVPAETILAKSSSQVCGGKGANQAVAAARAGGQVSMIGRVGDDSFAPQLIANLQRESVDCRAVQRTNNSASGLAIVGVEDSGENAIMVCSGANGLVTRADVEQFRPLLVSADLLLIQLEVPLDVVRAALEVARSHGVRVILDPAPAHPKLPRELLEVDLLCPNTLEATAITGQPIKGISSAAETARTLHKHGAKNVAITLGADGCLLFDGHTVEHFPALETQVVDTTAAGDAFAGAVAVKWAAGEELSEAIRFGNAAGALAAAQHGAQPGLPGRREIEQLLAT